MLQILGSNGNFTGDLESSIIPPIEVEDILHDIGDHINKPQIFIFFYL